MSRAFNVRIVLFICMIFTASCSTFQVRTDFDTAYKFSESATYVWDTDKGQAENLSVQRFRSALKAVLFEKGMMLESAPQSSPLAVRLHVFTEHRKEVKPRPYIGYWRLWNEGSNELYFHDYELEWFVVEFIDTNQQRIVWEGKASARSQNNISPQERDLRAEEAARELLKAFPPVKNLD